MRGSDAVIQQAEKATQPPRNAWPVIGEDGLLAGMVSAGQLDQAMREGRQQAVLAQILLPLPAKSLPTAQEFPHVHLDHPLHTVLVRLAAAGLDVLPVVSCLNVRVLMGTISLEDVLRAYGLAKERSAELVERPRD